MSGKEIGVRKILVVGDHFGALAAASAHVITFTEFLEFEAHERGTEPVEYAFGLGLSQRDRERVARAMLRGGGELVGVPQVGTYRETHKVSEDNRLVSSPRKLSPRLFELDLLLSGKSEQLSDHQTGLHVSGLVLEEAGRQSFLAVTERYFIPEGESADYYFAWIGTRTEYRRFAFALPTVLRYRIDEADLSDRARLRFNVVVTVYQAGQDVAEFQFTFTVYRKRQLAAKERQMAARALEAFLERGETAPAYGHLLTEHETQLLPIPRPRDKGGVEGEGAAPSVTLGPNDTAEVKA